MRTRTYHLVCFLVLLATLGVPEALPCHAGMVPAQVQSSTRQAQRSAQSQPHTRAAAQPADIGAPAIPATPVWQATLPPAHTAALQTHTTRA